MQQPKPLLHMPIKAKPYRHQINAFNFVCGKFVLVTSQTMPSVGAALLMEMGTARYRLLLTGTVITNKAIDVFSQYKFLNPAIFGQSFYVFRNRYFDMVGYGQHTPVLKKSMEQDLMKRLHRIAFRATKAECLDLPETTDIVRYI